MIGQLAGAVEYTECIFAESKTLPTECPRYGIKLSDGEAPALKIWGMWNTSSLPLLSGLL